MSAHLKVIVQVEVTVLQGVDRAQVAQRVGQVAAEWGESIPWVVEVLPGEVVESESEPPKLMILPPD